MTSMLDFSANEKLLSANIYPGRGIIIGLSPDGSRFVQVYWIMGRSENSRNRVFVRENDFVRTKAFDESKCSDPSLIIYYPARHSGHCHIISNGDQTDTVYNALEKNERADEALCTRMYEPDAPNFTPRITGIIDCGKKEFYLAILKKQQHNESSVKTFFRYESFMPGSGFCIHTYAADGNPLPSFKGEPYAVGIMDTDKETAEKYWALLNKENRISLMVKSFDVKGGNIGISVINRYS